jgi:hypothetical protein
MSFFLPGEGKASHLTLNRVIPWPIWDRLVAALKEQEEDDPLEVEKIVRACRLGEAYAVLNYKGSKEDVAVVRKRLQEEFPSMWEVFTEGGSQFVHDWPEEDRTRWMKREWDMLRADLKL